MRFLSRRTRRRSVDTYAFYDVGFHGDQVLLAVVDGIMRTARAFVETGANVGSTLAYVARRFPAVRCISCEPDPGAYEQAEKNIADLPNASVFCETSQVFVKGLFTRWPEVVNQEVLFWLDAHGYGFEWPLRGEISVITRRFPAARILVDDFKVPGLDCFGYDRHGDQECSFEFIRVALNPAHSYRLIYPNYTERTSLHHPLRGWGLLEFGHDRSRYFPADIEARLRRVQYSPGSGNPD